MTSTLEERTKVWRELHQSYRNIMEDHEHDVDLDWTRDTANYVMDRKLYHSYCRLSSFSYMRRMVQNHRSMRTCFQFIFGSVNPPNRPMNFTWNQFNNIVKKYPKIEGSSELLSKKEILANIDAGMSITTDTINTINRRHLMCRNIAPEPPQHRLLPHPNVERLQDILNELESEKEKISEGLYLRLCDKLMGLKIE